MKSHRIMVIGLSLALSSTLLTSLAYAGRCDGNNGNGNGNICQPEPQQPAQPTTPPKETDRQYIERVHSYAHGNSYYIKVLNERSHVTNAAVAANGEQIDGLKKDQVRQDEALKADQVRQDKEVAQIKGNVTSNTVAIAKQEGRLDGHDKTLAQHQGRLDGQDKTLTQHDERLDSHDDMFASHGAKIHAQAGYSAGNRAMIDSLYGIANDHESRISSLERRMDKMSEANAIALAVAGHQFNTQGGFQTAISASTMDGKQALAIGAGGAINERLFINAGVSQSGSTTGGVVSSTIAW